MPRPIPTGPVLGLQHFLLQTSFFHAYRGAVRATRPLPDPQTRRETLNWLRSDIERLRLVSDIAQLNAALVDFKRSVKIIAPQMGLSGLDDQNGAKLVGRGGARSWGSGRGR